MSKPPVHEPLVVASSEPLPDDPELLVAQIKKYAALRRQLAANHDRRCRCTPCRVRKYDEAHAFVRQTAA